VTTPTDLPERFASAWLTLREPVDHRSRATELLAPLSRRLPQGRPVRLLDLGSGTGSNVRYLAPRLAGEQEWTLLDHDPELLGHSPWEASGVRVERVVGTLAGEGIRRIAQHDVVTASALLDLVSEGWMGEVVAACVEAGVPALFALSYSGKLAWGSEDPLDVAVTGWVNAHQKRDKGTGPALGPDAARFAAAAFQRAGWEVTLSSAPWRLAGADAALALELLAGWEGAASEEAPAEAGAIREWAARKREMIGSGSFTLEVEHLDLLALPPSDAGRSWGAGEAPTLERTPE
jgi:hypothetical protein